MNSIGVGHLDWGEKKRGGGDGFGISREKTKGRLGKEGRRIDERHGRGTHGISTHGAIANDHLF